MGFKERIVGFDAREMWLDPALQWNAKRREDFSVLERLFRRGDLLAERMEKSVSKGFFIPTQKEIEDALSGRLDCSYGLTSQGGARWEEVSRPQWQRYLTAWVYADPLEGGEITGSDRQMVEKYDSLSHYYLGVSAVPGSKQWDVLEPWQATYGKELPLGHRVRFRYESVQLSPEERSLRCRSGLRKFTTGTHRTLNRETV